MKLAGKKVLVTGHTGFIGKNLINKLNEQNVDIVTLTDYDGKRIDVRDWEKIKRIRTPDIIYHLAAITYVPFSFSHPRETYEVNVLGTLNILELARKTGTDKVIFTSSYVYGNPQYLPLDEKHPLNPNNPYTRSKLLAERLLNSYNEDFGLKSIIFRPFNIYGIGQRNEFLIPQIINQMKKGKIELKDPDPRRDFIHISDVINALIIAGKCDYDFEIFNLGYGKSYSVNEIVNIILNSYKNPVEVIYTGQKRKNEVNETIANIDKIKEKLNWKPAIDIDVGIEQIVKYYTGEQ